MPATSASDRSTIASIAVETSWAHTPDRAARTAPGRAAADRRFRVQVVDPDDHLSRAEQDRLMAAMDPADPVNADLTWKHRGTDASGRSRRRWVRAASPE